MCFSATLARCGGSDERKRAPFQAEADSLSGTSLGAEPSCAQALERRHAEPASRLLAVTLELRSRLLAETAAARASFLERCANWQEEVDPDAITQRKQALLACSPSRLLRLFAMPRFRG